MAGVVVVSVMWHQQTLTIATRGRGTTNITGEVNAVLAGQDIRIGLCHLFIEHTSASLILCENADPDVRADLETFMARTVPDGDPMFRHVDEGPDDMSAHVRTILTDASLSIPIRDGRCGLGTWQGIFLWEHRAMPHQRRVTVTMHGE